MDEESGGFGTKDLVKRRRLASAAIIAEPTQGQIMASEGGLEWVRVTIRGRNAHAGWRYNDIYPQPPTSDQGEPGVNAAELAARFILAVGQLERDWGRRKPALECKAVGVGAYLGGSCTETEVSARACTYVAIATQPDVMLAKPGMGVDEGIMAVRNEQGHALAEISSRLRTVNDDAPSTIS